MLSGTFTKKVLIPSGHSENRPETNSMLSLGSRFKKKALVFLIASATLLSLWYDGKITSSIKGAQSANGRELSVNLGNGECLYEAAIQWTDPKFPNDKTLHKTIIAGYPSGDKRIAYLQLEGMTGLSARDEWDFLFLGATNQPFIKANYPHHEGIWGWGDVGDQVVLIVSELKRVVIEYHDILWDIGYAQTYEEAYERIQDLYKTTEEEGTTENAPVEDFFVWRDLRCFDEIHWYSWFIDYYMENGLMRDMFTHEITSEGQWMIATLPHLFTKFEMRQGRFVDEDEIAALEPSYDPMCATLTKGCYPVQVIDPVKLADHTLGPAESRKLGKVVQGTEGFDDWMIEEEAWECIWSNLIVERKGISTFLDKAIAYDTYTYSYEMRNEMWHEINRLIEKYEVKTDQVAIDLVEILRGHRDALGIDTPSDPITYEFLMGYHLAFPPFFPNQKMFKSDDDFYVNVHEKYENPDRNNIISIIQRRREFFEEQMALKRERKVVVKYYDATGWRKLPEGGLLPLTPYHRSTTTKIDYDQSGGEFADSGRENDVAALFEGFLHIDVMVTQICITSDDGSKLYLDDVLWIDNDGLHGPKKKCAPVTWGVYKLDLEFFERQGGAMMVLSWGGEDGLLRVVPPRAWASTASRVRFRALMKMNELLEWDLANLKETDIMGPTTRAEYNLRKEAADGTGSEPRQLKKYDFTKFDKALFARRQEQKKFEKGLR